MKAYAYAADTTAFYIASYDDAVSGKLTAKTAGVTPPATPFSAYEDKETGLYKMEVSSSTLMVVVVDRTNRLYAYSKQVVDLEGETVTLPVVFRPWRATWIYVEDGWRFVDASRAPETKPPNTIPTPMNTPRHMLNVFAPCGGALRFGPYEPLCEHDDPHGRSPRLAPPVIVNMTPDNFATGRPTVGHGKIYIEFDEFVQLKDQQKEFFTSPAMKKKAAHHPARPGHRRAAARHAGPEYDLCAQFRRRHPRQQRGQPALFDALRLLDGSRDRLDGPFGLYGRQLQGRLRVEELHLVLPADSVEQVAGYDSTIFKYKPAAIARAENNGIFIAQNLKPIPYRVYAVQDKNDNQMYEPGSDQVGFLEGTYNPAEMPDFGMWYDSIRRYVTAEPQLYFRMFTDKAFRRQVLSQTERPLQHKAMLYFAAARPKITRLRFDSIPADRVIVDPQTVGRDTIALWFNVPSSSLPDTIKGEITYFKHDTVNQLQEVTEPLKLAWRLIETRSRSANARNSNANAARPRPRARSGWNPRRRTPSPSRCPLRARSTPRIT